MKLYYSPGSCSLAPHLVHEEIGKPYATELISTDDDSTKSPAYRRINPRGRVPALALDDELLTEAAAIMVYLAKRHPEAKLLPNDELAYARCIEWLSWLSSHVHAMCVAQIWRTERFSDNVDYFTGIQDKGRLNLKAAYADIDERFNKLTWAAGDQFSIADAHLIVFYRWGQRLGMDMRADYPNWSKHTMRMLERPAVQAVLDKEQINVWKQ